MVSVWTISAGITIDFPMILNLFKKEYSELGVVEDSNSSMEKGIVNLESGWALTDLHCVSRIRGDGGGLFS